MLIFAKDDLGYRMVEAEYNGINFVTKDDEHISETKSFVVNIENISAILQGNVPRKVHEVGTPDLEAKQAMEYFEKYGIGIDMDMRIHRKACPPLTVLTADYIAPMIMMHVKFCEDNKKNPETVPMSIGQIENEYGPQPVLVMGGMIPLPIMKQEGGEIHIHQDKLLKHDRLVLKFMDWYAVPNNSRRMPPICTFKLQKFMENTVPTNAKGIMEALGNHKFITDYGVVKSSFNIGFSIDDILGEQGG